MFFIETDIFQEQLDKLWRKYPKIKEDFYNFKSKFDIKLWKDLWKWIYKFRIWNSSIPTWKRWGFRIILYIIFKKNKIIPIAIYSKTEKENISLKEILEILNKILENL